MVEKTAVGGGGDGDDAGDGMVCSEHPYSGGNPGGICAFCLQEKLGKLVSSSKSSSPFFSSSSSILPPSSSSSSSPSFRSDAGNGGAGGGSGSASASASASRSARPRIPFFSTQSSFYQHQNSSTSTNTKKKPTSSSSTTTTSASDAGLAVLKRSRSVAPRPLPVGFLPDARGTAADGSMDSPRRRHFWSFLHLSRTKRTAATTTATTISRSDRHPDSTAADHGVASTTIGSVKTTTKRDYASEATAAGGGGGESPSGSQSSSSASFGRKVARSKSVGCGSRSFSGDFLERISTGFGDCTLRRVESQREAKPKVASLSHHRVSTAGEDERMKERVRCGGIFGGFGMISSSSYSYWFSDDFNGGAGGAAAARVSSSSSSVAASGGGAPHGRSWSWGWAFASPMRAFRTSSTTTTTTNKHHHHHPYHPPTKTAAATSTSSAATITTTTPKLAGVPSLLAVNG
ncbi:hypothetical protein QJS10_CPB22g00377 [Acorus calamus]|uniref:Uncharacterized protein n=1 Tax=Acorus calamus TaxID=4465 RepID=A0AAV9C0I1_ACOCL|nr:hypothetical protein QJS10_CPB22g00377 [Acorus calamus]